MKKVQKFIVAALLPLWGLGGLAQHPPIKIQWTAERNCEHYPLDSVVITNKANGETKTVHYPDTVFVWYDDLGMNELQVTSKHLRVYPNPFSNTTQVEFSLAKYGEADLAVYDLAGREIVRQISVLERGTHQFTISLPQGIYTLSLQTAEGVQSARLASEGNAAPQIVASPQPSPKERELSPSLGGVRGGEKMLKSDNTNFPSQYGDALVFQCFITLNDTVLTEEHTVLLTENAEIVFAFSQKAEMPFTEYVLNGTCQWTNFASDTLIIINSNAELENYIAGTDFPAIDFNLYSLLLVSGTTDYGSISHIAKSFVQLCTNEYRLNLGIHLQDTMNSEQWIVAVLVPKVKPNEVVLNRYYPHVEVWVCVEKYWDPNVTITLIMDTLQRNFYVSTIPQDLDFMNTGYFTGITAPFADGWYGKYSVSEYNYEGTIFTYMFFGVGNLYEVTMFSHDSMRLKVQTGPLDFRSYLFIRQNF